jgi:hypothetical protein
MVEVSVHWIIATTQLVIVKTIQDSTSSRLLPGSLCCTAANAKKSRVALVQLATH